MNFECRFYPEARFGGFADIDGTVVFFARVNSLIDSSFVVLDVGCGRGASMEDPVNFRRDLRVLRGKVAKVIGIDVDRSGEANSYVDEFRLIQGEGWPIDDDAIDLIVVDNVLEHIENPERFFLEIHRCLRNGGFLCIRTPNRWGWPALAATIIPEKHHLSVLSFAQRERKEVDIFPTFYRCNSIGKLKRIMENSGFDCVVYGYEAAPSYLSFSMAAYYLGVLHQRFAPGFFKPALFAFGKIRKGADH